MPEASTLLAFIMAAIAMQALPGPNMMIVITRALTQGSAHAQASIAGIAAAGLIQVPLLVFGVASIFQSSELAYSILKYLGAIYMIVIGILYLTAKKPEDSPTPQHLNSIKAAFFQGLWSNLLNPKVWVFLVSFVPQFVEPSLGSVALQLTIFGVIMKISGFVVMNITAFLAAKMKTLIKQNTTFFGFQQKLVGVVFTLFGIKLLLESH